MITVSAAKELGKWLGKHPEGGACFQGGESIEMRLSLGAVPGLCGQLPEVSHKVRAPFAIDLLQLRDAVAAVEDARTDQRRNDQRERAR